jgi:hypothetical protein
MKSLQQESNINPEFQADADKLEKFVSMYCRSHHKDREKESFDFTYQRVPVRIESGSKLCAECSKLLKYAIIMRVQCPLDPKPRCRKCPQNCFRPDHWKSMEEVMKYSGPRSIFQR